MVKMKNIFYIICVFFLALCGCEKVINIKLDEGTPQLAVDAFINDKPGIQTIRLTKTSGYFENNPSPEATGATVTLTDNEGYIYNFTDGSNTGNYTWSAGSTTDTLVRIFNSYTLTINYSGEKFISTSIAFPAPNIDSLSYDTIQKSGGGGKAPGSKGYFASFYANDISGMPNFYWIRSYNNGVFYSDPQYMNISQDGAFVGSASDGFLFIIPIREFITPQDKPLQKNDSVTVEIHAINFETYFFLQEVQQQTTNAGLFATPPANVATNIKNTDAASKIKAVGWFNIGAVTSNGIRIK